VSETYGEDPYRVSAMGVAYTHGLQGKALSKGVLATAKHYLSLHKSRHAERFLADYPRLHFHFTPSIQVRSAARADLGGVPFPAATTDDVGPSNLVNATRSIDERR
jgi:beta-glucosidase-like glycosyl hydrolase